MKEVLFYALAFVSAFSIVAIAMPTLIKVAHLKGITDKPDRLRKKHRKATPTIGGVVVFMGLVLTFTFWVPTDLSQGLFKEFKVLVLATIVLFFLGFKDDIIGVSPIKKILAISVITYFLVSFGGVRLTHLGAYFEVHTLPDFVAYTFSFLLCIVFINAYNLIDGMDGLAGGYGTIASLTFALIFANHGDVVYALLGFITAGVLIAFLCFNWFPARIFMGDSGSLVLGAILFFLGVKMGSLPMREFSFSTTNLAIITLFYPILDTIRVFVVRLKNGRSPFTADHNHLHHLLQIVFNVRQSVVVILCVQCILIGLVIWNPFKSIYFEFISITLFVLSLVFLLRWKIKRKIGNKRTLY